MKRQKEIALVISEHTIPLSDSSLDELACILIERKLKKGTLFLKEGEIADSMCVISRGMMRQFYIKKGYDVTEHITYEGHLFVCLESFIRQQPSKICVEALEATVLYEIPYAAFHDLMNRNVEILRLYCAILESSLLISQRKADARCRQTALERYCALEREHPEIIRRAPQIYVASLLGMTPETLSRIRSGQCKT